MSDTLTLRLQNTNIFVVGDLVLDEYIEGKVSRISPEAPVPVLLESGRRSVLGGAGNVAANITSFGARATLCGRVGDDAEALIMRALCAEKGIATDGLVTSPGEPTTRKTRVLAGYQQLVRLDRESTRALASHHERSIAAAFETFLSSAPEAHKALVISDYGKGVITDSLLSRLLPRAEEAGVPVVTDPKSVFLSRYAGTTVLKPNLKEARDAYAAQCPGEPPFAMLTEEVEALCSFLRSESQAHNIVLSLAEHGVACYGTDTDGLVTFRATSLEVADVSGAGDTMIAFLAMGLASGLPLAETTRVANVAAGVVCGKLGTATLTPSEFFGALSHNPFSPAKKILSASDVVTLAKEWRARGRRVVFTNGCFDILHAGHVDLLQKARALGDVLVVGLNADVSVRLLKGPERPLQAENDRAAILSGLACVDAVVLYSEETPRDLIRAVRPDVLVKGGDYRIEEIVGHEDVQGWGGEVTTVALVEGRSTTGIVKKMRGGL